jgi:hypothetical protein
MTRAVLIVSGDLRGVIVTGEIDIAATSLLESAVTESGSADAGTGLRSGPVFLLNLTDVTFLDGSGLPGRAQEHTEANGFQVRGSPSFAPGPRRMLRLAVDRGWLYPLYRPADDSRP